MGTVRFVVRVMLVLCVGCGLGWGQTPAPAAPSDGGKPIAWQMGPINADLGGVATIKVPQGMRFADGNGARRLLELSQNPSSGDEVGVMMPIRKAGDESNSWVMLFEFHNTGYVDDKDKGKLDADALLESLKKGTEEANEERKKKGWTAFHVTGWSTPPFFDDATKNLTWGIVGQEDNAAADDKTVNYSVRILGRRGTMSVDLILSPEQVAGVVPTFNGLLKGFSYTAGSRYAEFTKGDKVAGYGLAALIAGGAATAAVKTGLLTKLIALLASLWKVILVAFAAIGARFRKLLDWVKEKFGSKRRNELEPGSRDDDQAS